MARQRLKIYGERNTGTNYLAKLIELNLGVEQLPGVVPDWLLNAQKQLPAKEAIKDIYFSMTFRRNLGWKHMLVKPAAEMGRYATGLDEVVFLTLTKNPYSWLLSLHRRPYHKDYFGKGEFEAFLTTPWKPVGRENLGRATVTPIQLWNLKSASYIRLLEHLPTLHLRFETLLDDPRQVVKIISNAIGLDWNQDEFRNFEKSTKESRRDYDFYRDYYLNEKWKLDFSTAAIDIANQGLDGDVLAYFGYSKWEHS